MEVYEALKDIKIRTQDLLAYIEEKMKIYEDN